MSLCLLMDTKISKMQNHICVYTINIYMFCLFLSRYIRVIFFFILLFYTMKRNYVFI